VENKKVKIKKRICSEVSVGPKQSGEFVETVLEKIREATVRRVCRK